MPDQNSSTNDTALSSIDTTAASDTSDTSNTGAPSTPVDGPDLISTPGAELKAPEPTPAPAPTAAPAPAPTAAPAIKASEPAPATDFEQLVERVLQTGTQGQKGLLSSLQQYVEALRPGKPMDGIVGARHQHTLWTALISVIESAPAEDFKSYWQLVLAFFEQYKDGVFNERYLFRFAEYWSWSETELSAFQRLLNLIKLTASPAERAKGLKQVNLDKTLAEGFSDRARQTLVTFYKG